LMSSPTESGVPPLAEPDVLLTAFDFSPPTRVVYGAGAIDRLGEVAQAVGKRALVVTDPGVRRAGHASRGAAALEKSGIRATIFDGVEENPTTKHVADCVAAARAAECDLLVGLGGGSSMDTAKGANFLLSCGGKMSDYQGIGRATGPMLPMIAVPTTAGTGSEAQSFALIADETTHRKMACGDKRAACRVAILDPEATVSQPEAVTAIVGIDAIAHAVESYVTRTRNAMSTTFAKNAWNLLASNYALVIAEPRNLAARGAMLLGAHLAGAAIENSMLGAAHAAANPLTARFGITHGIAVGVMLPHVVRYNAAVRDAWYRELLGGDCGPDAGETLVGLLRLLMRQAKLPATLEELDVDFAAIPSLAEEAASQWTAAHNPRPIGAPEFAELYRQAFVGD
jgi:alcohol dehydrogenase